MKLNLVITFLLCLIWEIKCAKILFVEPFPAHSHFILTFRLAKEMADRGHEVTVINTYPQKKPIKNYRDVVVEEVNDYVQERKNQLLDQSNVSIFGKIKSMFAMGLTVTELTFKNKNVDKLLNGGGETFDLVVVESFFNEALYGMGYRFKAPIIILSSISTNILNNFLVANPAPSSYVPNVLGTSAAHMNFWQRLGNLLTNTMMNFIRDVIYLPHQQDIFKKYISADISLNDVLYNNVSLILANSHISVNDPSPKVPAVIEIGGFHVDPPKKLPGDLQKFLDNSKEGVILFSMGSNLKSKDLKPEARAALLNAFSKIKQKVLWKFEADLPEAPSNVKIMSWIPQQDVLAHPNIRAFITHGGLLSTIETIYHGVPIIGIPVFGDQKTNIARAVNYGYALSIPLDEVTEANLSKAINEILSNSTYRENVKQRSKLMHDQPLKPIDSAVYWMEHVIRHKGAPHLRCAGLDLRWYQRELIDVVGFLIAAAIAVSTLLYITIKKIVNFLFTKKSKVSKSKKVN